jgi:hypothetical protein
MNWKLISVKIASIKKFMLELYAAKGFVASYSMLFIDSM